MEPQEGIQLFRPQKLVKLELNLEELPWAVLCKRRIQQIEFSREVQTAQGRQTKKWIVSGGELGLPGPFDTDVYVALAKLYAEQGMPDDGRIFFTLYRLAKILQHPINGFTINEARQSIRCLAEVKFRSDEIFYLKTEQLYAEGGFPLFINWKIRGRRSASHHEASAFVQLHPYIANNLRGFHVTDLDLDFYLQLGNPVAKKLFRLLDRIRAEHTTFSVGLLKLGEMMPLFQKYPSQIRRVLGPAHDLLLSKGIIQDVQEADGEDRQPILMYRLSPKYKGSSLNPHADLLLEDMQELLQDERSVPFYRQVALEIPEHVVRTCLSEVRMYKLTGEIQKTPGAYFTYLLKQKCAQMGIPFRWGGGPKAA